MRVSGRGLEVPLVDLDDVADGVDEQAHRLAAHPDDDHHRLALGARRQAERDPQVDRGQHLAAEVDQTGDPRGRQRHPGAGLAAQHLLHLLDRDGQRVAVQREGRELGAHAITASGSARHRVRRLPAASAAVKKFGSAARIADADVEQLDHPVADDRGAEQAVVLDVAAHVDVVHDVDDLLDHEGDAAAARSCRR